MNTNLDVLKLFEKYSSDIITSHKHDGEIIYISQNCFQILGFTPEEAIGKRPENFIHSDDLLSFKKLLIHKEKSNIGMCFRMKNKNNDYVWFETRAIISEGEDSVDPPDIIFISKEISIRKKREEELDEYRDKLKFLLEGTNESFWELSLEEGDCELNKEYAHLFGIYQNESFSVSMLWGRSVHPDDREKIHKAVNEHIEGITNHFKVEYRIMTKEGEWKWMLIRGKITRRSGERPLIITGALSDISERKHYENELLSFKKSESIAILSGGIAHDFSNLLTTIIGNISILKIIIEKGDKEKVQRILGNMEKASLSAKELTLGLLKVSQGRIIAKLPGSIEKVIYAVVENYKDQKNLGFTYDFAQNLHIIDLNEEQLEQALGNVITNSIESMPNGGNITIKAENVEIKEDDILTLKSGKYIKLQIIDEGIGIPKGHISQIFDPYFTTKERTNEKGSGLGLAMTYSIIRNHNGHIIASSEIEKGTLMSIYLPSSAKK